MARNFPGRVKIGLMNTYNEAFNEYPCYTTKNFMDDQQTTQLDAQNFAGAYGTLITNLTTNTVNTVSVEYNVDLGSIT